MNNPKPTAGPMRVKHPWQAQADATRKPDPARMAPPVPGITVNAGYVIRAVLPGHPAGNGLLESWWVAAERGKPGDEDHEWVTWEAYALDGDQAGRLAYNAGHYFYSGAPAANKQDALLDLARRAGIIRD